MTVRSLFLCFMVSACATAPAPIVPRKPVVMTSVHPGFPSKEQVQSVTAEPPPALLFGDKMTDDEAWDLTGPLPDVPTGAPHSDDSPWFKSLARYTAAHPGLVTSEAMYCAARETGLFLLANHALPSIVLRDFLEARCGVTEVGTTGRYLMGDAPLKMSEAALFKQLGPKLEQLVSAAGTGPGAAGIWFGRKDKHIVVMLLSGVRRANLDPVTIDANGHVHVQGQLLIPSMSVRAVAVQGRWDVAPCAIDPTVSLPRFSLVCEPRPDADGSARIDIMAFAPGRFLGTDVVSLLTWPTNTPLRRPPTPDLPAAPVVDAAGFAQQLLALVNDRRQAAGRTPLTLDTAESTSLSTVAPYYFAAALGHAPIDYADKIARGACAGWDVTGTVTRGSFASGIVTPTKDAGALVAYLMSRPTSREVLMKADTSSIAFGPVMTNGVLGTIIGAYATLDEKADLAANVFARLKAARDDAHAGPTSSMKGLDAKLRRAVESVRTGQLGADDALTELVNAATSDRNERFKGWWLLVGSLDQLHFPAELLAKGPLEVAIHAAPYRGPNDPWTGYLVFIVRPIADDGTTQDAPSLASIQPGGSCENRDRCSL